MDCSIIKLMEVLLNPNVSYFLLMLGISLAILAVLMPGTGLLEIGALFALALAGYGIFNLAVNLWALGLLLLGVVPFILALRRPRSWYFLLLTLALQITGSVFLFRSEGRSEAVNPALAVIVSTADALFFYFIARKALQLRKAPKRHDPDALLGQSGVTRTEVHESGTVLIGAELWSARSRQPIPPEMPVRVVQREGLVLEVEAQPQDTPTPGQQG